MYELAEEIELLINALANQNDGYFWADNRDAYNRIRVVMQTVEARGADGHGMRSLRAIRDKLMEKLI